MNMLHREISARLAIPLENGCLCSHFGHCQQFAISDIKNGKVVRKELIIPPPHEPGLLPSWLAERGVTHVIAGGMGQRALQLFAGRNIQVVVGAQPKPSDELVTDWIAHRLQTTGNVCDH